MREIAKVILHCSDSRFGDARLIDTWHRSNGWTMIGYHFVIPNGYRRSTADYDIRADGIIERGRPLDEDHLLEPNEIGAHTYKENEDSIGICLVGKTRFTVRQMVAAVELAEHLITIHPRLTHEDIRGHYEFNTKKTCPGFSIQSFRRLMGRYRPIGFSLN